MKKEHIDGMVDEILNVMVNKYAKTGIRKAKELTIPQDIREGIKKYWDQVEKENRK